MVLVIYGCRKHFFIKSSKALSKQTSRISWLGVAVLNTREGEIIPQFQIYSSGGVNVIQFFSYYYKVLGRKEEMVFIDYITQQVAHDIQKVKDSTTNCTFSRHPTNSNQTQTTVANRFLHDGIPNQSSWRPPTQSPTRRQAGRQNVFPRDVRMQCFRPRG